MFRAQLYRITKSGSTKWLVLLTIAASVVVALLPHYHSLDEIMTCMGETAHVFILFGAIMIATRENGRGTLQNVVSSGMKRSAIYYSKLKVVILAAILFFLIDGGITLAIGLSYHRYPMTMAIPAILANAGYHLLIVILGAMLYYAIASFIADPVWSVMICLAYFLFAEQALADISTRFKLPVALDPFVLGGIRNFDIMNVEAGGLAGIIVNVLFVFVVVLLVPAFMTKRDMK